MTKEEIFQIIFKKKLHNQPLTDEEKIQALKYFREDEINGFRVSKFKCERKSVSPIACIKLSK